MRPGLLIATLGTKPQVVTTALDLLLADGVALAEVWVVHTDSPVLAAARAALCGEFERHGPYRAIDLKEIELFGGTDPSADSDDETAVRALFDGLYRCLRAAKLADPLRPIHLSLVGGRKVIALYAMVAAQLVFGDDDRVWYVAVDGQTQTDESLHLAPGRARLVPVPLLSAGAGALAWLDPAADADPFAASAALQAKQLRVELDEARGFVLGALSGAERRVLTLLVRAGLGNADLGQRLHLSPRTIERHLGDIARKAADHWSLPGAPSRTQLVALLAPFFSLQAVGENEGNPA